MVIKRLFIFLVLFLSKPFLFSQLQVRNYFSVTGKKDVPVNVITQDPAGYLWLGTHEGVYKFDGKTASDVFKDYAFLKKEISALLIAKDKTVWVGTKDGKVFSVKNNLVDSVDFGKAGNEEKITSICELNATVY